MKNRKRMVFKFIRLYGTLPKWERRTLFNYPGRELFRVTSSRNFYKYKSAGI